MRSYMYTFACNLWRKENYISLFIDATNARTVCRQCLFILCVCFFYFIFLKWSFQWHFYRFHAESSNFHSHAFCLRFLWIFVFNFWYHVVAERCGNATCPRLWCISSIVNLNASLKLSRRFFFSKTKCLFMVMVVCSILRYSILW